MCVVVVAVLVLVVVLVVVVVVVVMWILLLTAETDEGDEETGGEGQCLCGGVGPVEGVDHTPRQEHGACEHHTHQHEVVHPLGARHLHVVTHRHIPRQN